MYQVHGARGEDPTEPPASAPYPFPAVSHEPRIQQLHDDLARPATTRSTPPAASCSTRSSRSSAPCIRCKDLRRLPLPRPRQVRRRGARRAPGAAASQRHAADRRPGRQAEHQRRGHGRDRGRRRARRAAGDLPGRHRRRLVRRRQLGQAAAALGQRQAPQRPGQRLGPGRPQLHVPQQRGGAGDLQGAEPDQVPEDARPERLLLRHARLRLSDGQHPDGRQVAGADVQGREADRGRAGADVHAGRGRQARRRLLAVHRGPAQAGQPRHAGARRQHQAQLHAEQPGAQADSSTTSSKSMLNHLRHARAPDPRATCT